MFSALPVTFKQEVQNVEVKEGDRGVLCCELSKPGAPVDWRKGRVILKPGDKYEMRQEANLTELIICNVDESDAGKYTCKTKDGQSTAELSVRGENVGRKSEGSNHPHFVEQFPTALCPFFPAAPPITFKAKLRDQKVEEENSVTLSCELSKPGLVAEWRRGGELLKNNVKYQMKSRSGVLELTIKNTQLEDSGLYSCSHGDAKTTANVTVTCTSYTSF